MKNSILILAFLTAFLTHSQEVKQIPLISVNGEGKVKVIPDQVAISVSLESKGAKAADVKKENDLKIDAVLKFIKKMNIDKKDFQTQRVSLNDQFDYQKKKHNYVATQTVVIDLKDLTKYDDLMEGLMDAGINNINGVQFTSSKLEIYKSEARKLAIKEAKLKAEDYVSVLGQKVGKAFTITDNSQNYNPIQNRMYAMAAKSFDIESEPRETLAIGEIEIIINVQVTFLLE